MLKLYAENILIGSQWQKKQTLFIDPLGCITAIESGKAPQATPLDGWVIPGMVNCHSHAFQRILAGCSEYRGNSNDSFWTWRDLMYRLVEKIDPQALYRIARFVYLEMLKSGYTSVAEFHYLHHQQKGKYYQDPAEMSHSIIHAAYSLGIALTHLPVFYSFSGFGKQTAEHAQKRFYHSRDQYFKLIESLQREYANKKNFQLGVAPHSLRAVSQEQLKDLLSFVKNTERNMPVHIHIAEQQQEVDDCLAFYKKRPVEFLLEHFSTGVNWCLIHATHLNQSEIKSLAKNRLVVGLCPTTEANLGDGIFPAAEFLTLGGEIAMGSDSHITVNVAEELKTLEYGQRLTQHQRVILADENCPSVGQFLYLKSAQNGAKAIAQNAGSIEIGKRADLVVLDQNHPLLYQKPPHLVLDTSIFACNQLPVKDVFVAGKQVIDCARHLSEESIIKDYKELACSDKILG